MEKRCPQYCIVTDEGQDVCGCAAEQYLKTHTLPPSPEATEGPTSDKREVKKRCPQYCIDTDNGETLCGCAALEYEKTHPGLATRDSEAIR